MISIFKKNLFFNSLLLLPYVAILRIHTLIYPTKYAVSDSDTLLTKLLFDSLHHPLVQSIVAIILVFLQAILINHIAAKNRIALRATLLPGMLYALLVGFLPSYSGLSPALIANAFLIWALFEIMCIYKKSFSASYLFNFGFAVGAATLLISDAWFFLFFGLVGLAILSSFNIIKTLQIIVGFVVPIYLFYALSHIANLPLNGELSKYGLGFNGLALVPVTAYLKTFVMVVVTFLLALIGYNSFSKKKSIDVQKKIDLFYWSLLSSLLVVLFAGLLNPYLVILFFPAVSILLHLHILSFKNTPLAEVLHFGLIALSISFYFGLL